MKTVLFHRNFRGFTGGHLKVWHYFEHVRASATYQPAIYFTPESIWDDGNPWLSQRNKTLPAYDAVEPDILFLGGFDWLALREDRRASLVPIINLIQGFRHADPSSALYPFLANKAVRICVSPEVADAVRGTGIANGPLITIPNGLDARDLPRPKNQSDRRYDLCILALKQPEAGRELANRFRDRCRVALITTKLRRGDYLNSMNDARVTVVLPRRTEGFFLPALEGMAVESIVVCPDCVGNRSFCLHEDTCYRPDYTSRAIAGSVEKALQMTPDQASAMKSRASEMVRRHDIQIERASFLKVLNDIDRTWRDR